MGKTGIAANRQYILYSSWTVQMQLDCTSAHMSNCTMSV